MKVVFAWPLVTPDIINLSGLYYTGEIGGTVRGFRQPLGRCHRRLATEVKRDGPLWGYQRFG